MWAFLYATLGTVGVDLLGRLWTISPLLSIGVGVAALTGFVVWVRWRHRKAQAG